MHILSAETPYKCRADLFRGAGSNDIFDALGQRRNIEVTHAYVHAFLSNICVNVLWTRAYLCLYECVLYSFLALNEKDLHLGDNFQNKKHTLHHHDSTSCWVWEEESLFWRVESVTAHTSIYDYFRAWISKPDWWSGTNCSRIRCSLLKPYRQHTHQPKNQFSHQSTFSIAPCTNKRSDDISSPSHFGNVKQLVLRHIKGHLNITVLLYNQIITTPSHLHACFTPCWQGRLVSERALQRRVPTSLRRQRHLRLNVIAIPVLVFVGCFE